MPLTKEQKARRDAIKLLKATPEIHCLDARSQYLYASLKVEILNRGYSGKLARLIPAWKTAETTN